MPRSRKLPCSECIHGKRNTGIVIPVREIEYFCMKVSAVKDDAAKDILELLLRQVAGSGNCPAFDEGRMEKDSYRAVDLTTGA